MATITKTGNRVNGLDLEALGSVVREIERDAKKGMVAFRVSTAWRGQTKSRSTVESYTIGGQEVRRHFEMDVDEPHELLGQNSAPNPQEMLMAAFNACITVGYVAGAALKGITLEKVRSRPPVSWTCAASSGSIPGCGRATSRSATPCGSRATARPSSTARFTRWC
jgi:organic hydroperoxide reductase OsmC/OhrA